MLAAWCQRSNKLDACVVFNSEKGTQNIFVKLSFEKASISLDYLQLCYERYCWVTKIIDNGQGYLLPKLEKINPAGSDQVREVADPELSIKMMKNQFAKKPWEAL